MYIADYHTHSNCSIDGSCTMTEMARAAIDAGLDEICLTDHVDTIIWNSTKRREAHDWSQTIAQYRDACAALGDKIKIRLGAEFGETGIHPDLARANMESAPPLDFVIGSVHTAAARNEWADFYYIDSREEAHWYDVIDGYLDEVERLLEIGDFDVLGHLTLPLRYANEHKGMHLSIERFTDRTDAIFRRLIETGRGIECNTNRGNTPLPDAPLLRRYRALGGEIITLGSDAHDTAQVGCCIRERQLLLRECGFTHFCTFEARRPIFHTIDH